MNESSRKQYELAHLARTAWRILLWNAAKESRHEHPVGKQEALLPREKVELAHYRDREASHTMLAGIVR